MERIELVFKIRVNSCIEGMAQIWQKAWPYYEKEWSSGSMKQMNVKLSDRIVVGIFVQVEVHCDF